MTDNTITISKYRIEYENGIVQEKFMIPKEIQFFTENSPLGEAIKTGKMILPEHQGGIKTVKVTKL